MSIEPFISAGSGVPSPSRDTIGDKLESLAAKLVDEALATNEDPEKNLGFTARLDVFKAISTYHLGRMKVKAKMPDDDPEAIDFGSVKRRINEASKGAA